MTVIPHCRLETDVSPQKNISHDDYSIFFVLEGTVDAVVSDRSYTFSPGELTFLGKGGTLSWMVRGSSYRRYILSLKATELETMIPDARLMALFRNQTDEIARRCKLKVYREQIEHCFASVMQECRDRDPYCEQIIGDLIGQILVYAYREFPDAFAPKNPNADRQVAQVMRYLETHYQEDLRIGDVARRNFVTPSYLSHLFQKNCGFSPKYYLQRVRLTQAARLLEETDENVTAIAEKCGFRTANDLIRAFKLRYGCTPLKHRKQKMLILPQEKTY